jgi:hypothetical protein
MESKNNSTVLVNTNLLDTAPLVIGFLSLGSLSASHMVLYKNPAANAGTNGRIYNKANGELI